MIKCSTFSVTSVHFYTLFCSCWERKAHVPPCWPCWAAALPRTRPPPSNSPPPPPPDLPRSTQPRTYSSRCVTGIYIKTLTCTNRHCIMHAAAFYKLAKLFTDTSLYHDFLPRKICNKLEIFLIFLSIIPD